MESFYLIICKLILYKLYHSINCSINMKLSENIRKSTTHPIILTTLVCTPCESTARTFSRSISSCYHRSLRRMTWFNSRCRKHHPLKAPCLELLKFLAGSPGIRHNWSLAERIFAWQLLTKLAERNKNPKKEKRKRGMKERKRRTKRKEKSDEREKEKGREKEEP